MVPDVLQRDDLDPDDRGRLEASLAVFVAAKVKHDAAIAYYRDTFDGGVPPNDDGYEEARVELDKSLDTIIDPTIDDTLRALGRKLYQKGNQ
jgi:hypothetical protein